MDEGKGYYVVDQRSGQIPAFGNWDYAADLPITQYFECARQAGLFRYSNSSNSGECAADIYAVNYFREKPPHKQKTRSTVISNKGLAHAEEQKTNQAKKKIKHVTEPQKKQLQQLLEHSNNIARRRQLQSTRRSATTCTPTVVVKAVDEDLYKIPPDLLHASKRQRKRRLGFFSRCLVPDCMV